MLKEMRIKAALKTIKKPIKFIPKLLLYFGQFVNFFDLYHGKLIILNFQPLDVVSRSRDPQPQVGENFSYLFNLRPNIT